MRTFLLPVLFTACFIFESIFLELTPGKYLHHDNLFVPHLLMIALILLTIYGNRNYGIMYGFIFGLLFDVIYIEIIGIYMVVFSNCMLFNFENHESASNQLNHRDIRNADWGYPA